VYLLDDILISFKLQSEVSTMKRSMSVADIQSSSNGEVAVLEELEDIMFQVCSVDGMSSLFM
jgi:AAA15 family ATPase/GTPase